MQYLSDEFEDFFQKISLKAKQRERIDSAVDALTAYLEQKYDLDEDDIFVQGSFSTNTVVRPAPSDLEGEYDVDIVVLCATEGMSPEDALESLEAVLEDNGNYKNKIEKDDPKIPCIRLRYADEDTARFHVDVVPALPTGNTEIKVPRKDEGWEESNPRKFTDWILSKGEKYQRTIMMLKRWRDEHKAPIKSIVFQVLAAECLGESGDDSVRIAETLRRMSDLLDITGNDVPEIYNPVMDYELLTGRWEPKDFLQFKELLAAAADTAEEALEKEAHDEAAALWQTVFGEDFIFQSDQQVIIGQDLYGLGNTDHVKPLIFRWAPAPEVTIDISAYYSVMLPPKMTSNGKRSRRLPSITTAKQQIQSREIVKQGGKLYYYADPQGLRKGSYELHWQVVNTGQEAAEARDLRGNFFLPNYAGMPEYNQETATYEGVHWVECFVVRGGVCVARSGRFYIKIVR